MKAFFFHLFLSIPLQFFLSIPLSAQLQKDIAFPYDTVMKQYMIRGEYTIEESDPEFLYKITYYCYDSLYDMGNNQRIDKKTHLPMRTGPKSNPSQHWFKTGLDQNLTRNRDTILYLHVNYVTVDNTVMYQYRDFRLFVRDSSGLYHSLRLRKAVENGYRSPVFKLMADDIDENIAKVKNCIIKNRKKRHFTPKNKKHWRYEGHH